MDDLKNYIAGVIEAVQNAIHEKNGPLNGMTTVTVELDVKSPSGDSVSKIVASVPVMFIGGVAREEKGLPMPSRN